MGYRSKTVFIGEEVLSTNVLTLNNTDIKKRPGRTQPHTSEFSGALLFDAKPEIALK